MKAHLTETLVDGLEPPANGNRILYDADRIDKAGKRKALGVVGFGARVTANGVVSYVLNYRIHGRERRLTIGKRHSWSVEKARARSRELRRQVDQGVDPLQVKIDHRQAPTVGELLDRYLDEHARVHNKPSSVKSIESLVDGMLRPALGNLKVRDVTREDISTWHHRRRGTPTRANRGLAVLSKSFNLAEVWDMRPQGTNPCVHVTKYREKPRDRLITTDELAALGETMADSDELPDVITTIKLLCLTGMRIGEVLDLLWDDVDLEAGRLKIRDAKAGDRDVILGAAAMELLAGLGRDGAYVVMKNGEPLDYDSVNRAWKRLCKTAKISNANIHDLRHLFGTSAGTAGYNQFIVRDLLGHKTLAMTNRYVQKDVDPQKAAADSVSGHIDAAMKGKKGEVIKLGR